MYKLTGNLTGFLNDSQKWLDFIDTDDDGYSDCYFEEYDKLISWTDKRTIDSGHLIGGPHISIFRNGDNVRIVWETEHQLENKIDLWTAKNGAIEIAPIMYVALSYDHRIIDGKESVGFLVAVKEALENSVELLMEGDINKALEL